MSAGNYKGRSGNFFRHSLAYWMMAKAQTYTFMIEKREKKFAWLQFKNAVRHHKWMNTPVIGKLKMPRETKKAVQKMSESLITQEQILQAVRRLEDAYSKPPKDHYILVYPPKVVELAKRQPDYEPLETYIEKIDKPYKGEVGRMRVLGRMCRIVEAGTLGREVFYVMRDDTTMYPDYLRGGQIK